MPKVEANVEVREISAVVFSDFGDELLRRHALLLGIEHDRGTVGVVARDKVHFVAAHTLESHPDICLDVLHHVANVEWAVGVRQRRGNEKLACHRNRAWRAARASDSSQSDVNHRCVARERVPTNTLEIVLRGIFKGEL